jgi:hypothetical protein
MGNRERIPLNSKEIPPVNPFVILSFVQKRDYKWFQLLIKPYIY